MAFRARISVTPSSTHSIRDLTFPADLVVTLQKDLNTGTFVAAAGETVTLTYTPAFGAIATPVGPVTAVTNGSGQAVFTHMGRACGQVSSTASAAPVVGGSPIPVSTNNIAPNSGPALTTWVDARLRFSTPIASNAVGAGHTWTVIVEKNAGSGAGYVAGTGTVSVALTNAGGAVASPAGPLSGAIVAGSFTTASFTSATPGQVIARATATVTNVAGITIVVATRRNERWGGFADAGALDPVDAVKTFV